LQWPDKSEDVTDDEFKLFDDIGKTGWLFIWKEIKGQKKIK